MKKKIVAMVACVVAIGALLVVYKIAKNNNEIVNDGETPIVSNEPITAAYTLVALPLEDMTQITVDKGEEKLTISNENDSIVIKDTDMTLLKSDSVIMMVNAITQIGSDNKIDEHQALSVYGLDNPQASVNYSKKDGTELSLLLGDVTADGNYYYALFEDNVYTIGKNTGDRIMQRVEQLADLSITDVDPAAIAMLDVNQQGRDELLISFEKENEMAQQQLNKSGLQTLTMHKPIEDLLVYPYNLETGLLYNYDSFKLNEMVEASDANFAQYGLDNPVMTIAMADLNNGVSLTVGNLTDDGSAYYVTIDDRKAVYTMPQKALEPFFNYEIINFIQKFVSLQYRYTLDSIDIKSIYGDYNITFKTEGDKKIFEQDGTTRDTRQEYVNNKAVDSEAFTDYYELLTGLTFDALENVQPNGEKQVEITYVLLDGTKEEIAFYDYDDTFFVAVKNNSENQLNMLINKQQVKQAVERSEQLYKEG